MSKQDPKHYQLPGKVQLIDVTKHTSFPVGSAIKYIFRAGNKPGESALDDLLKAKWFVDLMIQEAIENKAKRIKEGDEQIKACGEAGRPLKPCEDCPGKESCALQKVAQETPESPYEADDQIQLHSSITEVPEAITRAGIRRKIL